jgi:hypothetical protein
MGSAEVNRSRRFRKMDIWDQAYAAGSYGRLVEFSENTGFYQMNHNAEAD